MVEKGDTDKMPSWVKGGIIGGIVLFVLFVASWAIYLSTKPLDFATQDPSTITRISMLVVNLFSYTLGSIYNLLSIHSGGEMAVLFVLPLFVAFEGFIVGAIIGLIVGKIKNKKEAK